MQEGAAGGVVVFWDNSVVISRYGGGSLLNFVLL